MGLTNLGYRRRTLEEIIQSKIDKAKELFGEDINTEENTALGKYIRINAYDQYNVEEIAEQIYYSIFPQTATGQSLDRLAWGMGMTRNAAQPSRYEVKVTGLPRETVAVGFLVSTETRLNFYNTQDTAIGEDGTCTIIVECVEGGTIGNVNASDITKIVNPVSHIDTVQGISLEQAGLDEESDYEFRQRYEIVRDGKGGCNEASIISSLLSIPTVHGAYIVVNESVETVDGIPAKTFACYVDGGETKHQEIADVIFDKKPVGIGTYGTINVPVSYGGLKNYSINFSHSSEVDVYVKISIKTTNKFEGDRGIDKITTNIINYVNNLSIGTSLVPSAMYEQIYTVAGVVSSQITVSKNDGGYSMEDISLNPFECCRLAQLIITKDDEGEKVVYPTNEG